MKRRIKRYAVKSRVGAAGAWHVAKRFDTLAQAERYRDHLAATGYRHPFDLIVVDRGPA